MSAPLIRLTPEQAAIARRVAWDRYERHPHANPCVGRERYRAEIALIEELEAAR